MMEIKLNEKRYSLRTVSQIIGVSQMTVYNRAKRMGIDTKMGLTAEDAKKIMAYTSKQVRKHSAEELMEELGEVK